ncbi:hypothetical protein VTN77DRAFT_117 [Rasamsonia byssochlamydoides]|uniref:uncharacterized protein n=1 Tax=Rasamsonia byssochlamydoides TaxID=89139 RepID=UPI0037421F3E
MFGGVALHSDSDSKTFQPSGELGNLVQISLAARLSSTSSPFGPIQCSSQGMALSPLESLSSSTSSQSFTHSKDASGMTNALVAPAHGRERSLLTDDAFRDRDHLQCIFRSSINDVGSCSNHARTCMIAAVRLLQALHIPPPECLSACDESALSHLRQPRMTDSVLATNRDVILLVSGILICSCSTSFAVQLVLTTICSKLMAWYRAMVNNDRAGDEHTEQVLHQPIAVGGYFFDVALESKIRPQVVFSELQHLELLVHSLSRRIEEAGFGNLGPPTPDSEEPIHRSLIAFLHQQLQETKAEVAPLLTGSSLI